GRSIAILPATVTFETKQYHPRGFSSRMVLLPMTFTAGRTSTRLGFAVGSSVGPSEPTPNTLTPVAMTLVAAVPFLNGDALPHDAMQASSAGWSSARADVGTSVAAAISTAITCTFIIST